LAEAHCNLGNALHAQGSNEAAAQALLRAIALKPGLAEAHNNFGNVRKSQGRLKEAIASFRNAIQANPRYPEAWYNLGNTLLADVQYAEAETAYARALALAPRYAEAHNNRSQALRELGRGDEALAACKTAIALKPGYAEAHTNLGNLLQASQRWEAAVDAHREALQCNPRLVEAWSNLGNSLMALNRTEEALDAYRAAMKLRPGPSEIAYNECLARLLLGDIPGAWDDYDLRWELNHLRRRPVQDRPAWRGNDSLSGRSIVVYAEQGHGDTLQFARYLPLLAERGATVHAVVQKSLKSLIARIAGVASVTTADEPWPECDFHCPLLSLPRAFRTTLDSIPAKVPYIGASPERKKAAADLLRECGAPKVGVVWSGNPAHRNDRNRSLRLESLAPFLSSVIPRWVSLQKEIRPEEASVLRSAGAVDLSERLKDYEDTAAFVDSLDLVITVDTSVAHLAGAMGKRTWIFLPFAPDWRWLLGRKESPWYPTATLFRQEEPGSWLSVLRRVESELRSDSAKFTRAA
jgi:tetratricopeptide (TPR) repeat protein